MRDRFDYLIRNSNTAGKKTTDLPKLINPRMNTVRCHLENCNKGFAEQKGLNRHIREDHQKIIPDAEKKAYQCQYCSKSYSTQGWLIRHYRNDHSSANIPEETVTKTQQKRRKPQKESNIRENEDLPTSTRTFQVPTVGASTSTVPQEAISSEVLSFFRTDNTAKGNFRCPFAGCSKSTGSAKVMLNHGTSDHGWSFLTGGPKRTRKRKADDPVGGLSGGC